MLVMYAHPWPFRLGYKLVPKLGDLRIYNAVNVQLAERVNAGCFAVFARAFGWVEFSSVDSRTSRLLTVVTSPTDQVR